MIVIAILSLIINILLILMALGAGAIAGAALSVLEDLIRREKITFQTVMEILLAVMMIMTMTGSILLLPMGAVAVEEAIAALD